MLNGKRTYIGIIVTLAGVFGVFRFVSEGDLTTTLNTVAEFAGLAIAAYGRFKAKPKE